MERLGKMDAHGASRRGRERETNEDNFLIASLRRSMSVRQTSLGIEESSQVVGDSQGHLLFVADGTGGHRLGEVASSLAIETAIDRLLNDTSWPVDDDAVGGTPEEKLAGVFSDVQDELDAPLDQIGGEDASAPGSSMTLCCIVWPSLFLGHVGASRCYLLRDRELQRLTQGPGDATRRGRERSAHEEVPEHLPLRSVLWDVLGGSTSRIQPDLRRVVLRLGDVVLVASNGLSELLDEARITEILRTEESARGACAELLAAARARGAPDDCTAVVARFLGNVAADMRAAEMANEETTVPRGPTPGLPQVGVPESASTEPPAAGFAALGMTWRSTTRSGGDPKDPTRQPDPTPPVPPRRPGPSPSERPDPPETPAPIRLPGREQPEIEHPDPPPKPNVPG